MDFSGISLVAFIGVVIGVEKSVTWLLRYFNKAYDVKYEKQEFLRKCEQQEQIVNELRFTNKAIVSGVRELLKSELKQKHSEYMMQEFISSDDLHNFEELYNCYHNLGGNGTGTKWYDEVLTLPLKV